MDKTTKIILGFIAAGLWANAVMPLIRPAQAQADWLGRIAVDVQTIAHSVKGLVDGGPMTCGNKKLC